MNVDRKQISRRYYLKNREKVLARVKAYQKRNSAVVSARAIAWQKANAARARAHWRKYARSAKGRARDKRFRGSEKFRTYRAAKYHGDAVYRERVQKQSNRRARKITDSYVRSLLASGSPIPLAAFPPELVETKRAIIKLKRLCQNRKTSTNSATNSLTPSTP